MALNRRGSYLSGRAKQIRCCENSSVVVEQGSTLTCGRSCPKGHVRLISSAVEIRAPNTATPEVMATHGIPISPDTSLPWSEDFALHGWSGRMFLHQLLSISTPHWSPLDTERRLSEWTPLRLRASLGSGISLSDVIKPLGQASENCFRSARMVRGLIRRALARGRSFRLLLRTEHDTIPVIVTFGSRGGDSESWTVTSGMPLPDCLLDGLLSFLRQHEQGCAETLPSLSGSDGSGA